jgi:hypothetical protein
MTFPHEKKPDSIPIKIHTEQRWQSESHGSTDAWSPDAWLSVTGQILHDEGMKKRRV